MPLFPSLLQPNLFIQTLVNILSVLNKINTKQKGYQFNHYLKLATNCHIFLLKKLFWKRIKGNISLKNAGLSFFELVFIGWILFIYPM